MESPPRILFVCTANICRSPTAELLLLEWVGRRHVEAQVLSAGLLPPGREPPEKLSKILLSRGLDLAAHRSRQLSESVIANSDIVFTMERSHAREAAVLCPDAIERIMPLKVAARVHVAPGAGIDHVIKEVEARRTPADLLGMSTGDDVADPFGRSKRHYRQAIEEIDRLVSRVAQTIWG
ncbi:MAG: hypothetical protein GY724_29985 [Actinomycetia bacterium]|nr:hypothetical protein [Actinomycetes bacterium]